MSFFGELHRRNVVRVAVAYLVTAWLVLQVADVVMENIGAPPWVMQALMFLIGVGLIAALIFAWVFELTPDGLKLENEVAEGASVVGQTRRKLDIVIMGLLVIAVAYLFWDGQMRKSNEPSTASSSQSATNEKLAELSKLGTPTAPDASVDKDTSIAVLPFVNLSSDPEQEFFSDGISEELLNVLAQIPTLRVAARTSSFQFKGDNRDISEIAELLKVNHVLEGSVRKAGSRLRITAQLIAAEDGYHLWSETYDRELEDVFAIQDEISLAIADALRTELDLTPTGRALTARDTTNTPAYEAFLKGRGLINQRGRDGVTAGVRELERSILLDPTYAPARAQLAIGIALLTASSGTYGDLTLAEVNARAGEQIAAAEALDDDFAELWAARAVLARVNQKPAESLEYSDRALALRPNYADALNWRVNALQELGDPILSLEAKERLLDIDPLSIIGRLNAVGAISFQEPERATSIARSIAPQSPWASHVALSRVYRNTGRARPQVEELLLAYALSPSDLLVNFDLAFAYVEAQLTEEAMRLSHTVRPYIPLAVGKFKEAESALRTQHLADPENLETLSALAESLYYQGRFEEAAELWQDTLIDTLHGPMVYSNGGNITSLEFAHCLQLTGNIDLAEELIASVDKFYEQTASLGAQHRYWAFSMAILNLLKGNSEQALSHLQRADELGLRATFLRNESLHLLSPLRERPDFQVILENAQHRSQKDREEVLDLICNNNPIPNHWRPLDSSCNRS
ncbi:MAG: hypothetical protein AAGG55_09895 [Pseudomonadota bacterium]